MLKNRCLQPYIVYRYYHMTFINSKCSSPSTLSASNVAIVVDYAAFADDDAANIFSTVWPSPAWYRRRRHIGITSWQAL